MSTENQNLDIHIQRETADSRVTINYKRRSLAMCYVFEHELKTIGSANNKTSLDIGFFGACFGAFVAFLITVATVEIISPYAFAAFWALVGLFGIASAFFFVRYIMSRKESSQEVERILEESRNREPETII